MADHNKTKFVRTVKAHLRNNPRLERLSPDARAELEGEILAIVFLRKELKGQDFNAAYIAALVRYQLRPKPGRDPYVEKARRYADERQRWRLRVDAVSPLMTRRCPATAPIDELIEREEAVGKERLIREVESELRSLSPRAHAVMAKFLRGDSLRHDERCVWYRTVQSLRNRLSQHLS